MPIPYLFVHERTSLISLESPDGPSNCPMTEIHHLNGEKSNNFSVHFFRICHGTSEDTKKWSKQENQNFPFKPQESVMGLVERQEAPRKGE